MSRYLVTGATGFLGKHLVAALVADGHAVRALCRKNAPAIQAVGAEVVLGDVLDADSVKRAAEGVDGLFHAAGKVSRKPEDAEELFRIHVEGNKRTLDAARAAGVKRAVVASTSGVVCVSENPEDVRDETAPTPIDLIARWPYYRSKLYAERAAFDRNGPDFAVIAVNPTLLLGPGDDRDSSTGDVVRFLGGKVPVSPAGGISFVDARDAARAMVLAMQKGRPGERYLVSAANLTIAAFLGRLSRISGVPAPRVKLPRSLALAGAGASLLERAAKRFSIEPMLDRVSAEMAQCFWYVDASKAMRELGWTHRDPGETLVDTVEDLERRGVVWPRATAVRAES